MIVTLTLNPAVDKTIFVRGVALGAVNRVRHSHLDPAGNGIDVSRMVHRLQWPTIALAFTAGDAEPEAAVGTEPWRITPSKDSVEAQLCSHG